MITAPNPVRLLPTISTRLVAYHLGTPLSVHKSVVQRGFLFMSPVIICLCIYLVVSSWNKLGDLLFLCALAAADIFLLYIAWQGRYDQIVICSEGLLYIEWSKSDAAVRWDEIEQVQISTPNLYTIVRNDHTTFKFSAAGVWTQSKELRAGIEREVTQRFLPAAIAQFSQGQTVFFGGLSVGREGISGWFEKIPWSEIEDIQVQKGEVVVLKTGHRQERLLFSSMTPNLFVFAALVKHILSLRQS